MKKEHKALRRKSIKWSFILYIPVSAIIAYAGAYAIGIFSNYLQAYYLSQRGISIEYWLVTYGQAILVPLWALFIFMMTGVIFYKRKLEKPLKLLMEASEKIANSSLDFQITYQKENELGSLCRSFEKMRNALYQNNQEMWRMLEERKNLNAAFSHDMRTPITVLKGYRDLLAKYIPGGEVSEEKIMEILKLMGGQIDRLENYTQKMSALQKLEDIVPEQKETDYEKFAGKCREIGDILADGLQTVYVTDSKHNAAPVNIRIDEELVLEVYENLLSNAVRYAESKLEIGISISGDMLEISVEDDGKGFTAEALQKAAKPFYRGEKGVENQEERFHFGVGLYICKIICEKCHGELRIENGSRGGKVTAGFGNILEEI